MKTNPRTLLTLAAAGVAAVVVVKLISPSQDLVTGKSGKKWRVVLLGKTGETKEYEIFAPEGAWGPHPELSVLRYSQNGADMSSRKITGVGAGVPEAMTAGAAADFGLAFNPSNVLPLGTSGN